MVQIVQGPRSWGSKLGTGLSQVLNQLAENKLQQVSQRNKKNEISQGLEALGYSPEQSEGLAGLPVELLKNVTGGQTSENEEKRQEYVDATNKTWNTQFDKSLASAQKLHDLGTRLLQYISTGKVTLGLTGRLSPEFLLNNESREFQTVADEIAPIIAGQMGIPTNFKVKLAQSVKPNLTQSTSTQKRLAEEIIKQAGKILTKSQIRDELISQNNGRQPANLGSLVESRYRGLKKERNMVAKEDKKMDELDELRAYALKNNVPIGKKIRSSSGEVLYWDGNDFVENNELA